MVEGEQFNRGDLFCYVSDVLDGEGVLDLT